MLAAVLKGHGENEYSLFNVRLASFNRWPHVGRLSAVTFAEAGFYWIGRDDGVACFCCRLTLGKWTKQTNPLAIHRQLSGGRCDFVGRLSRGVDNEVLASVAESVARAYADLPFLPTSFDQLFKTAATLSESTSGNLPAAADESTSRHELRRLATYYGRSAWPSTSPVAPRELARAGFCYAGPGDRVQCAFCQGLLRNWESGDRAMALHAQHFTYCRFVQGHDVENLPIAFWPLNSELQTTESAPNEADSNLGISFATPKHGDMAVEARRLATFLTWPHEHHLLPEALVKAGFFFTGEHDGATCFHCGGTVTNWPAGCDAWTEHARRFPTCPFVAQVKGRQFIEQQLQRADSSDTSGDPVARAATTFAVDPREIRARMDSPMVRVLLRMDYPSDLVRGAIQKRLATVGRDHDTSEGLLADVFFMHDEMQRTTIGTVQPAAAVMPIVLSFPTSNDTARRVDTSGSFHPHCGLVAIAAAAGGADIVLAADTEEVQQELRQPALLLLPSAATSDVQQSVRQQNIGLSPEEENRQLKGQLVCKICMDSLVGIVFLPCGHFVCCVECAPALSTCPICRVAIRGTVRTVL